LPVWIVVVSEDKKVCQDLVFSYGIYPVHEPDPPQVWNEFAHQWLSSHTIEGDFVVLATGPSPRNPEANNRIELIEIRRP
jgi:pyruvate kinase